MTERFDDDLEITAEHEALLFADDECETAVCPACAGEGQQLGPLGSLMHYRCRHCGTTFSTQI